MKPGIHPAREPVALHDGAGRTEQFQRRHGAR